MCRQFTRSTVTALRVVVVSGGEFCVAFTPQCTGRGRKLWFKDGEGGVWGIAVKNHNIKRLIAEREFNQAIVHRLACVDLRHEVRDQYFRYR